MEKASDFSFISITAAITGTLAIPIFISFIQKQPKGISGAPVSVSDRSPASDTDKESSQLTTEVVDVDCKSEDISRVVQSGRLRIRGKNCASQMSLTIQNATNGYVASIIEPKKGEFTTDYIDLFEGENIIHIHAKDPSGLAVQRTLKVSRRSPASNP